MVAIKDMEMPKSCSECNLTTCKGYGEPWNYCCSVTLTDIDLNDTEKPSDCPLVEIQERKVGRWEKNEHTFWTCSECGLINKYNRIQYAYCPNCGSKMSDISTGSD